MIERTPLQEPLMMTASTASVALTASTLGPATTPCALVVAPTKAKGDVATTISVRLIGARTPSTVALVLIWSEPTPGTTSQRDVRRSRGQAKGSSREDYLRAAGVLRG